MDEKTFRPLLAKRLPVAWQAVIEGEGVRIVDDLYLEVGPADAPNAIVVVSAQAGSDVASLKRETLGAAAELLHNYHLPHPLTRAGFNHQVERLIREHGAISLAGAGGQLPRYTRFVDGGEVVAEPPESPRHKYGVYCELARPLDEAGIEARPEMAGTRRGPRTLSGDERVPLQLLMVG